MIDQTVLNQLLAYDSPTICDALESFGLRSLDSGYLPAKIKSFGTGHKPFIGFASTAKASTAAPAQAKMEQRGYYEHILSIPRPSISVIQDVDSTPAGALWGEVMAHTHACLGSVAMVTNGYVRDTDAVMDIGFGCFASGTVASRAYCHMVDYNCPVEICGLSINPGDLLFCDRFGVVLIPPQAASELAGACEKTIHAEEQMLLYCKRVLRSGQEAELETLLQYAGEMARLRKGIKN